MHAAINQGVDQMYSDMNGIDFGIGMSAVAVKNIRVVLQHPDVKNSSHGRELQHHLNSGKTPHQAVMHVLLPNNAPLRESLSQIPIINQRGSFLELVKHNIGGIASNLAALLGHKPEALNEIWHTVGGDIKALKEAIIIGAVKPVIPAEAVQKMSEENISGFFGDVWKGIKKVVHAGAGILSKVISVAAPIVKFIPILGPLAGKALEIANSVLVKVAAVTAPPVSTPAAVQQVVQALPVDKTGTPAGTFSASVKTGPAPATAGSFFSIFGFIFKSVLIISTLHISPTLKAVLTDVAFVAPLLFACYKKLFTR